MLTPQYICSLLPLLLCLCFQALSATVITHLPGFSGPLPFYLETGYVGVEEVNDVQLFYYFIKSEENPREDPVLLWLTGGPGCSALSGLAFDIGPLNFRKEKYNGSLPSLVYNPYSWTKVSNVIFLDSPVGTGFSYSRRSKDYEVGDIFVSQHVHTFLRKWFNDHPQFLANHLYIAGDSYAGKVIPVIAEEVSEGPTERQQKFQQFFFAVGLIQISGGAIAQTAEHRSMIKYERRCEEPNFFSVPFILETTGGFSIKMEPLLRRLALVLADVERSEILIVL